MDLVLLFVCLFQQLPTGILTTFLQQVEIEGESGNFMEAALQKERLKAKATLRNLVEENVKLEKELKQTTEKLWWPFHSL